MPAVKESLFDIPPGCICQGDGRLGMKCEAPKHATFKNRVVVRRADSTDGWTELFLSCGHSVNVMTDAGEGYPAPCTECLLILLEGMNAPR